MVTIILVTIPPIIIMIANELAAWASFQPLYDMITQKEPDLFE